MTVRAVARSSLVTSTITGFFLIGCSLATSWNDLPIGPLDTPDGSRVDAGKTVIDSGPVVADSGPDAADSGAEGMCAPGEFVCGPSGAGTDAIDALYACPDKAGDSQVLVTVCTHGCVKRQPAVSDACKCDIDGLYCGNDQIPGDPNTLYRCNPDLSGTEVMKCAAGCEVDKVGQDDKCK